MTRPAVHFSGVQQKPAAVEPNGPFVAPKPAGLSRGWRVALFLWASAFVCLLAYELLNTLVRTLSRLF